ncbi:MAG: hypothetical protein NTV62_02725 [Candidatus Gribaldobacteria bacterium]|nr:hypothetical protein [Candidatus Gribaldobacteria bacterium]
MAKLKDFNNFKTGDKIKGAFGWINRHPTLILLGLLILDAYLCWFLYSKYYLSLDTKNVAASNIVKIDRNLLTKISNEWQKREANIKIIETKTYPDYFSFGDNRLVNSSASSSLKITTSSINQISSSTAESP